MSHVSQLPHGSFLLVVAGVVTLAVIGATMVVVRRSLRARFIDRRPGDGGSIAPSAGSGMAIRDALTNGSGADGVLRALAERGLVDGTQLASMSSAEREFFLAAVAAKLGDGVKPRLMTQTRVAGAAPGAVAAAAVALDPVEEPVPHAALVSGVIHCPVCRTPIGKRSEAPVLMSRCPGCSRRVAAHIDGDRLSVTLHYTLRTPAMGVVTIKS